MNSSLSLMMKLTVQFHLWYLLRNTTILSVIIRLILKLEVVWFWQVIAQGGQVSELYFASGTINQHVYLEECVKKCVRSMRPKREIHLLYQDQQNLSGHFARESTNS